MGFACSRKRGESSVAGTPGGDLEVDKKIRCSQHPAKPSRPSLASFPAYFTWMSPCPQMPHLLLLKSDPSTSELCLPPFLCLEASEDTCQPGQPPGMLAATAGFLENLRKPLVVVKTHANPSSSPRLATNHGQWHGYTT